MAEMGSIAEKMAIEQAMPFEDRTKAKTAYQLLRDTAMKFPDRKAVSFQLTSGPGDAAETLNWQEFLFKSTQTANMLRRHGIGDGDVVAFLLPTTTDTALTLIGGMTAGIVSPINPLLEPEKIAAILRDTDAKILITMAGLPKTDVAQKAAKAVSLAPNVKKIIEIDLIRHLSPPKSWIARLIRPKVARDHQAEILNFHAEIAKEDGAKLTFAEETNDPVCALFHTGGTTGMPKVAQHRHSGLIYNGWCTTEIVFTEEDVLMCPMPLFHVFAAYPVLASCLYSGAHMVIPTPQGYRGDGVLDNYWKLAEYWGVTFMVTVPTAVSALMQRPVNADLSTVRYALCGSAPLPLELIRRFEDATSIKILEGYGMTEATCLVSCNPIHGERKVGSVGLPFPYTDVKIYDCASDGSIIAEKPIGEVGEICVSNPGVVTGETYKDPHRNAGLFTPDGFLRTGDLGKVDEDNYIYITGRAKDLIIRGGHNIDPALIEEALSGHDQVAFVGAIGQPDAHSGELPVAYVELIEGGVVEVDELMAYAKAHIQERAAIPKYIEIVPELPKTAVGKTLKNELRKSAIKRIYQQALDAADLESQVTDVIEDKFRGLVCEISCENAAVTDDAVRGALGGFARPWQWKDATKTP